MFTKRELVSEAFAEIGLASYEFDITPAEAQSCLRRLDGMMAEWNSRGIRIGYLLPTADLSSDLDQDSGVPDEALEAIRLNLAKRIGPSYGKQLDMATLGNARSTYLALLSRYSEVLPVQTTQLLPKGAGHKHVYNPFFPTADDKFSVGGDDYLNL